MEELHAGLKDLQNALQTLLKKYNSLKKENEHLKNTNAELNKLLSEKEKFLNAVEERVASNNIAVFYNDEEKQLLQAKIDTYLKDIEKCLALLNA